MKNKKSQEILFKVWAWPQALGSKFMNEIFLGIVYDFSSRTSVDDIFLEFPQDFDQNE